jgi:hypothetical protein
MAHNGTKGIYWSIAATILAALLAFFGDRQLTLNAQQSEHEATIIQLREQVAMDHAFIIDLQTQIRDGRCHSGER